jgi:ferredoxin
MSTPVKSASTETALDAFLNVQEQTSWAKAVESILPSVHDVDKNGVQIWFAFYPLDLFRAFQRSADPEQLAQQLLMQGQYYLQDQIDSSHRFLYGHRYWPAVKAAVIERGRSFNLAENSSLADLILATARGVAAQLKIDESLVTGITAVAFMTLAQVGCAAFSASAGTVMINKKEGDKSPADSLRERAKDDGQGLLGFLKTVNKRWTVTFDENDPQAKYKLNNMQDLAWGAADDRTRDWKALDPRRIEGPIPVECRSASCGTCWVGVLGGAEKLSEVAAREGKKIKEFGYIKTTEPKPLIRLACQAKAYGAVSIVIPPWNGVFGKYLDAHKNQRDDD